MFLRRSQASEAQVVLRALGRRLLALRPASVPEPSLAGGDAGLALVHAVLDPVFPGAGHARASTRALDRAIEALATTPLSTGLYSGFTGVAWTAELLRGDPSVPEEEDLNSGIDEALEGYLERTPWVDPYDLIEGLVGVGVYALERVPRPSATRLLSRIVDRLAELAQRRRPGVAWRSNPAWLPTGLRQEPFPTWNLGVAHGVPGVIAFLGGVCASGIGGGTQTKAHALLERAVAWLLAHELPASAAGAFAYAVGAGVSKRPSRAAWCYGDPGVAAALLVAARATRERAWEKRAVAIAVRAAKRPVDDAGVVDAGLCHGAAGLGHVFHRLYTVTEDERFATAGRAWFDRALAMRRSRGGFAGFLAYEPTKGSTDGGWEARPDFLMGGAGIALALAAATTNAEPAWDRSLLLSVR